MLADLADRSSGVLNRALAKVARVSAPVRMVTDVASICVATLIVLGVVAWPILIAFVPVLMACRLYAPHQGVTPKTLLGDLPRLLAGSTVAAFVLAALYPNIGGYTLRDAALVSAVTFAFLVVGRGTMHLVAEILRARGFGVRPTLIVGRGPTVAHLVEKIAKHPDLGMRVLGVITDARGRDDDLSLVAGMRPAYREALQEAGLGTVEALAAHPRDDPPVTLTRRAWTRLHEQAGLQVACTFIK